MEGYRRALLDGKVRAVKAAKSKVPVDEVVVDPAEYPDLLEAVYKASSFPKPRNVSVWRRACRCPKWKSSS
jgi:predicted nucleic acid-binding Zn finger protein